MVLDNVTLIEVHLARETDATDETDAHEANRESESSAQSSGRSKGRLLLVALVLVGVAFGVRKLRSRGDEEDIEMAYEEPGVEVEQSEA